MFTWVQGVRHMQIYLPASVGVCRQLIPPASKAAAAIGLLPQSLDLHQGQLAPTPQKMLPGGATSTTAGLPA